METQPRDQGGAPHEKQANLSSTKSEKSLEDNEKTRHEDGSSIDTLDDASPKVEDYPTGLNLFFVILALTLSIFLASLDMVFHPSCR
jgi:hypothetical protein